MWSDLDNRPMQSRPMELLCPQNLADVTSRPFDTDMLPTEGHLCQGHRTKTTSREYRLDEFRGARPEEADLVSGSKQVRQFDPPPSRNHDTQFRNLNWRPRCTSARCSKHELTEIHLLDSDLRLADQPGNTWWSCGNTIPRSYSARKWQFHADRHSTVPYHRAPRHRDGHQEQTPGSALTAVATRSAEPNLKNNVKI